MPFAKLTETGHIIEFSFGADIYHQWETKTTTLEAAIRRFRVGCPQPYKYVSKENQITETIKDGEYEEEIVVGAKPKAKIPVFTRIDGRQKQITSIPVEEDASVPLLSGDVSAKVSAVVKLDLTGQSLIHNRQGVDFQMLQLDRKKAELELMKAKMGAELEKLQEQVAIAMKSIWMVELYIGSKQQLVELRRGAAAPITERITVMQRVLCMDEELLMWAWFNRPEFLGNDKKGFDYKNIEDFDRWLLESDKNVDQIIPAKKGIIALRVRRDKKERPCQSIADAFANIGEESADQQTYILVRNGENLYRIWADTTLWPRFFPTKAEFDINTDAKDEYGFPEHSSYDLEELQESKEGYLRGLIVLQGLLDHTMVFHPLPSRIVVFDDAHVEKYMRLIRDDEPALAADNSMMGWDQYKKWLRSQVRVGARVLYSGPRYSRKDDDISERTGVRSVLNWPSEDIPYTITEHIDSEKSWRGGDWKFVYHPGDTIYHRWEPDTERKRGVGFRAYSDEVTPLDAISLRYLKHLLLDRSQREHYARALPLLHTWWKLAKAEAAHEEPFIRLVLSQAGVQHDDPARREEVARCRRLVRWWKLRTKETRTLDTDQSKALRMIVKAFKAGEDYDADPERGLPAPECVKPENGENNA